MEIILYITLGIILGALFGWLLAKANSSKETQSNKDIAVQKFNELEKIYVGMKATTDTQIKLQMNFLKQKLRKYPR